MGCHSRFRAFDREEHQRWTWPSELETVAFQREELGLFWFR